MSRWQKFKASVGDLAAIVAAVLGLVPGLLKKKTFKLLRWSSPARAWEKQNDRPFSGRQCRKLMAELVRIGDDPRLFVIVRWDAHAPAAGPEGIE